MKLERGIARAAELAPNKWYQAPKTEEIIDPGGYGRRRYRVTTALGTCCVTYESNHGPAATRCATGSRRRGRTATMTSRKRLSRTGTTKGCN
jgi:hypothetical protein